MYRRLRASLARLAAVLNVLRRLDELESAVYRIEQTVIELEEATPGWDDIYHSGAQAGEYDELQRQIDNLRDWTAKRHHTHP
jgi:hypothetical protein